MVDKGWGRRGHLGEKRGECGSKKETQEMLVMLELFRVLTVVVDTDAFTLTRSISTGDKVVKNLGCTHTQLHTRTNEYE